MRIEVTDNYVLVDGIFYYREQGDTNVEQENMCHVKDSSYVDNYDGYEYWLSCGHFMTIDDEECPNYCAWCGAKVKHL